MRPDHSFNVVSPDWATLQPTFDRLAIATLTIAMLAPWLEEWSTLEKAISETIALAAIAASRDTADADAQALDLRLAGEDTHRLDEQHLLLALRLVDLPDLPVALLPLARAANDRAATFRADHLPDQKRQA